MDNFESNVIRSFNKIKKEMMELQDELVFLRKDFEGLLKELEKIKITKPRKKRKRKTKKNLKI